MIEIIVSILVLSFSVVLISIITIEDALHTISKMNNDIHKHKTDED